jgi:DNA repair exonuclease SbcCD nuclease subunit
MELIIMRILVLADIHVGSIKDTSYVYDVITDIFEKEIIFKKTDLVVICGDYFHRLFKVNEEFVSLSINIMSYLIRACKRNNTKIRIVYGTESHEMNQYRLFNYHMTSERIDMKVYDTVTEEVINGEHFLFIPEEYMTDKHEFYKKYFNKHYEYIFGHGIIEEGMPMVVSYSNSKPDEKQVPRFKSNELSDISDLCIFGHYHCYTDLGNNIYYLGSLFRDSFGEEQAKGYGIIEDGKFTFVENTKAYVYKTYEFDPSSEIYQSSDNILKEINKIKSENKDIFNGDHRGKIRIIFKTPENVDTSFRENLKDILFNDKYISPMIKETSNEIVDEVKEDIDDEYDFILDNSLSIEDKIYQYMNKQYGDDVMSMELLTNYLKDAFK